MENISRITRRDIIKILTEGISVDDFWESKIVRKIDYFGKLELSEFLGRLYNLDELPSRDPRVATAKHEIAMHTRNGDWGDDFVFSDPRFGLDGGGDEFLLDFLKMVFHPEVREENSDWRFILDEINGLLKEDGYKIYPKGTTSGRVEYDWTLFDRSEDFFLPLSFRDEYCPEVLCSLILSKEARSHIACCLEKYNQSFEMLDGNYRYYETTIQRFEENIRKFGAYEEMSRDGQNLLSESNISAFISQASPLQIFEMIEYFAWSLEDFDFSNEVNRIFDLFKASAILGNKGIVLLSDEQITCSPVFEQEFRLTDLIRKASEQFEKGDYANALEKIWDAFERLKSYYAESKKGKRDSTDRLITLMSEGSDCFNTILNEEITYLTTIGNSTSIRHFERTVEDLSSDKHRRYLYNRCLSIIKLASEYLEYNDNDNCAD